jgi:hypothetical protein
VAQMRERTSPFRAQRWDGSEPSRGADAATKESSSGADAGREDYGLSKSVGQG